MYGYLTKHCKTCDHWYHDWWNYGCGRLSYSDCEHIKAIDEKPRHKYVFEGPVRVFDNYISQRWRGETVAVSKHQARVNLCYQVKKQFGYSVGAKVVLCGKINEVN